jgi:hypothetical protein
MMCKEMKLSCHNNGKDKNGIYGGIEYEGNLGFY